MTPPRRRDFALIRMILCIFSLSSTALPAPHSLFLAPSLSIVWSDNLLIIGCKKNLLRDYARYKKLTGDGSQKLFASLMRPGDCSSRSAEAERGAPSSPSPPTSPAALRPGPALLAERQLGPAQPGSAQLRLGAVLLHLALVGVINAFTASSSAAGLSVIRAREFCNPPPHPSQHIHTLPAHSPSICRLL